ncbi:dihydrofolate reductase [Fusobacterium polymorphum]|uniref:dihydrofolate reductase n=1 Tax=Fusobacterium nucleatum subsp. polymorphum TaxID=76857 RepID=UPI002301CBA5|nr:dihydrofolate reductase family protein [Fusobacterium nucleatum]WCB32560.1 dihydrofolate reductase family protein [Fusobacterium nucleatum]
MEKKYYKNLKMIVCVGKDNLIGDRTPDEISNGMLWHIKEELMYFKSKTIGNTVLFGGTTAKYVPIELIKKNREVIVLHRNMDVPKLIEDLTLQNKTIFIAGGYSIYKYFLDNFEINEIFFSKIKDTVEVKKAVEPLYLPNIEDYGYKIVDKKDYEEFTAYVYKK